MKGLVRRRTVRRGAIIALIAAAELGGAGFVVEAVASAGSGLTSTATVSIDGIAGTWAPAPTQSSAVAPAPAGVAEAPAAPADPPPGQSVTPTTPPALETTPSTPASAGVTTVDAPSGSSEPETTTP